MTERKDSLHVMRTRSNDEKNTTRMTTQRMRKTRTAPKQCLPFCIERVLQQTNARQRYTREGSFHSSEEPQPIRLSRQFVI